jgi:glycyl-tRNA synthetase beta chain
LRTLLECRLDLNLPDLIRQSAESQPVRSSVDGEVYDFIAERLRGLLLDRDDGTTGEMIDAVLAGRPTSPLDAVDRLQSLRSFLQLPEAAVLTAINKRISNILRKAASSNHPTVEAAALTEAAERALHDVLQSLSGKVRVAVSQRRYIDALTALTALATPVNDFFDQTMVMVPDALVRNNRLALLHDVQTLLGGVADLSRLPG